MAAALACLECKTRFARSRGLCGTCYSRRSREVRAGRTTWEKLERAGQARPARRRPWGLRPDKPQ